MTPTPPASAGLSTPRSPRTEGGPPAGGSAGVEGAEVRPAHALRPEERRALRALMEAHYADVDGPAFEADLDEKDAVVLLRDATGVLRGFSTLLRLQVCVEGREAVAFFSGDTVVEAEHRHTAALPRAWSRHVFAEARREASRPTYWFLICSGYKTYRFLPTFYRRFIPAPETSAETDAGAGADSWEAALLGHLARTRYGAGYDARTGIVRLAHPTPLLPGVADLTDARLRDPHVAFFAARNPGWPQGDELACLCRIHPDNLTDAGRRMVGPGLARPLPSDPFPLLP